MSTNDQLTIVGGDSKLDMFQQLLDIGRKMQNKPPFIVTVKADHVGGDMQIMLPLQITGIAAESGDGDSWILTGRFLGGDTSWADRAIRLVLPDGRFTAYYNTKRRQGSMSAPRD